MIGGTVEQNLSVLLTKAFQAYRQSLLQKIRRDSSWLVRDFNSLTFLGAIGRIPALDRLRLRRLELACSQGLSSSRRGDLDDALSFYGEAQEILALLEDDMGLAWTIGRSTYEAGTAYLDFRRGLTEQACERLGFAMDADLELEDAGMTVMQIHRIQQGHNLARMHFRLGNWDVALRLGGLLIAYLEGQIWQLPFHHGWRPKALRSVPRSLLRSMIHQILSECAVFIITNGKEPDGWSHLIETSLLCRNPESAVCPQAQFALWAQCSRRSANPIGYLINLERFLSQGILECSRLWYLLVVELAEFCLEVDTHRADEVRTAILRDSAKWKGLPSFLRGRLPVLPSEQNSLA
jgi:hypothetical protein